MIGTFIATAALTYVAYREAIRQEAVQARADQIEGQMDVVFQDYYATRFSLQETLKRLKPLAVEMDQTFAMKYKLWGQY